MYTHRQINIHLGAFILTQIQISMHYSKIHVRSHIYTQRYAYAQQAQTYTFSNAQIGIHKCTCKYSRARRHIRTPTSDHVHIAYHKASQKIVGYIRQDGSFFIITYPLHKHTGVRKHVVFIYCGFNITFTLNKSSKVHLYF